MNKAEVKKIINSDKTKINPFYSDSFLKIWGKKEDKLKSTNISSTLICGGGSFNGLWLLFLLRCRYNFFDEILDAPGYCNILSFCLAEAARSINLTEYVFMNDNDPKQKSKLVHEYLEENTIETLIWPAESQI